MYGLPTSPKDWGNYRDQEFRCLQLRCEDEGYGLIQSKADESLWFLRKFVGEEYGEVVGLLVVYVDDLAVFSSVAICNAFIKAVQEKWKTCSATWFGVDPVTFCGVEIILTGRGYRLAQTAYLQELLQRYGVEGTSSVPLNKWTEPELPSQVVLEDVRAAQGITGALLWIATRSRPDISFSVSKMGQLATKAPRITIELGMQVLAYLNSTSTLGIEFLFNAGSYFSDHGNLSIPRVDGTIEIYSDASHSPAGDRSTQCVIILWRGSPLVWESTRQPFTTLSSAESELVSMVHSIQLTESLQPLIDELLGQDSTMSLLGDNAAAVRAVDMAGTGWRNRHLRMRAVAGRERVLAGLLKVAHLPGEYQVADLGTKPLSRVRIMQLLELINIRSSSDVLKAVRTARMLSRLSLTGISSLPLSAEVLAGLALLAAVPRVSAQPGGSEIGVASGLYSWVVVVVVVGLIGIGYRWRSDGGLCQGQGELEASPGGIPEEATSQPEDFASSEPEVSSGKAFGNEGVGTESEDEFTAEEWAKAEAKLRAAELRTGLTFVQRVRLRRQLSAGGIVDVPVFQQRYGPLPSWLTGHTGQGSEAPVGSSEGLHQVASILTVCGGCLLALIGSSAPEWGSLSLCCRELQRSAVLTLVRQGRDAGTPYNDLEGVCSSSGAGASSSGHQNDNHLPQPSRLGDLPERKGPVASVSAEMLQSDQEGSPESSEILQSDQEGSPVSAEILQSDQEGSPGVVAFSHPVVEAPSGFNGVLSSEQVGGLGGPSPVEGLTGSTGLPAGVQIGGSSSSRDVFRYAGEGPEEEGRGSSSSHGMGGTELEDTGYYYEDYFPHEGSLAAWPLVGTWLRVHFLAQLFISTGEPLLQMLGLRTRSVLVLRETANVVRFALYGAVVDWS